MGHVYKKIINHKGHFRTIYHVLLLFEIFLDLVIRHPVRQTRLQVLWPKINYVVHQINHFSTVFAKSNNSSKYKKSILQKFNDL